MNKLNICLVIFGHLHSFKLDTRSNNIKAKTGNGLNQAGVTGARGGRGHSTGARGTSGIGDNEGGTGSKLKEGGAGTASHCRSR